MSKNIVQTLSIINSSNIEIKTFDINYEAKPNDVICGKSYNELLKTLTDSLDKSYYKTIIIPKYTKVLFNNNDEYGFFVEFTEDIEVFEPSNYSYINSNLHPLLIYNYFKIIKDLNKDEYVDKPKYKYINILSQLNVFIQLMYSYYTGAKIHVNISHDNMQSKSFYKFKLQIKELKMKNKDSKNITLSTVSLSTNKIMSAEYSSDDVYNDNMEESLELISDKIMHNPKNTLHLYDAMHSPRQIRLDEPHMYYYIEVITCLINYSINLSNDSNKIKHRLICPILSNNNDIINFIRYIMNNTNISISDTIYYEILLYCRNLQNMMHLNLDDYSEHFNALIDCNILDSSRNIELKTLSDWRKSLNP